MMKMNKKMKMKRKKKKKQKKKKCGPATPRHPTPGRTAVRSSML